MTSPDASPPLTLSRRLALAFVFLWFAIGGLCHFLFTPSFVRIVPPSLPYALAAVYVSGVFELLGAAGLTLRRTRRYAGWGLAVLTVAVTPANVYMWQHPELFPSVPVPLLFWRLPFQVVLIIGILWSSRRLA